MTRSLLFYTVGPGGDYRSMLKCKAFVNDGYFVVFYDQRGSGLSKRHPKKDYNSDIMIEDLGAIIQHFRKSPDQKVLLLGHSWGAMLATAYINRHPSEINGAILSEPGGFTWNVTKDYISRTRELDFFSEVINDAVYYDQILTAKDDEHEILDYKFALTTVVEHASGNPLGNAGPYPNWRSGSVVQIALFDIAEEQGLDYTTSLSQFTTPVVFMYSELNRAYGHSHAQFLSSAYPNAQLKLVRGTGHEMLWFGWDNYYQTVLEYLNELN